MSEPWTLTEDDFKARQDTANEALQEAAMREPGPAWWGVESYGDGPAAWGGGVGGFAWFETQEEVLDFMAEHLTFLSPGPSAVDPGRVGREAQAIMASWREGAEAEATRLRLNVALKGFQQVRWWGPLHDLLNSEAEFPREVRAWFRGELEDEAEEAAPIQDEEELAEFLGMLSQWGL